MNIWDSTNETLTQMATSTWVPPIKRLPEAPTFEQLMRHHEEETKILMQTIKILAIELMNERDS